MMFRILLKKQFFELFRTWFYNPKTNQSRSKLGKLGMAISFCVLAVGVLGGIFSVFAMKICGAMTMAGVSWMYFALFGLIAVALGLFGSVLNTHSVLYLSKDNDLLLSMPIPVGTLVAARVSTTYLMGTLYSAMVFLPAVVVFQISGGWNGAALAGGLVMLLQISLLVLVLSCFLGLAVAKISLKLKNRSFVTVLASLTFMALYYYVYFKAEMLIQNLVVNAAVYGAKIKGSAYLLYRWGENGAGNLTSALLYLLACLALTVITWLILSKTFLGIATVTTGTRKGAKSKAEQKEKSLSAALFDKERKRFTTNANYMLNCGLGTLMIPAAGVMLLIKGAGIFQVISQELSQSMEAFPVFAAGMATMLVSMNNSAAPSISLEGNSLWLIQSLPVDPWQVIWAKTKVQLIFTAVPMAFFCVCVGIALPLSALELTMISVAAMLVTVLFSLFSMFMGLKMPILNWTNETVPIKQSGGVLFAIFGVWGYAALLVGGYFLLARWLDTLSAVGYLAGFAIFTVMLSAGLYRWLKRRGREILRTL